MRLEVPCPAKLNLFLSVGPPGRNGYHPLRTVFQAIGLFDVLTISEADRTEIVCDEPLPLENTLTKALRLLNELAVLPPLRIHLAKAIPPESGLGGGSSDAAGLIRAMDTLVPGAYREADLKAVASAVGMDVPFFLVGGRAKGEGLGERLTPLPDPKPEWYLVLRPEVGCATADAYRRLDETRREWREFPKEDETYNDFERVAPCESLELMERLLAHGARDAGLTGSGSAVFGRFTEKGDARRVKDALAAEAKAQAWVAPALTRAESLAVLQE
jgi:4-diphosphocytidyl-2-C-methyl-D-erythritol kinase